MLGSHTIDVGVAGLPAGRRQLIHRLNMDVVIDTIRHGFEPQRCIFEIRHYNNLIDFRAIGPNEEPVARVLGLSVSDVLDRAGLCACIRETRACLEKKGFKLQAWMPPR